MWSHQKQTPPLEVTHNQKRAHKYQSFFLWNKGFVSTNQGLQPLGSALERLALKTSGFENK